METDTPYIVKRNKNYTIFSRFCGKEINSITAVPDHSNCISSQWRWAHCLLFYKDQQCSLMDILKRTDSPRVGEPHQTTSFSFTVSGDYKRVSGSDRPSKELLQLLLWSVKALPVYGAVIQKISNHINDGDLTDILTSFHMRKKYIQKCRLTSFGQTYIICLL